jgi:hypothetical protein
MNVFWNRYLRSKLGLRHMLGITPSDDAFAVDLGPVTPTRIPPDDAWVVGDEPCGRSTGRRRTTTPPRGRSTRQRLNPGCGLHVRIISV